MTDSGPSTPRLPPPGEPLRYVLITPARNEEAYIELTIKSVVAQKLRPLRWVIVSDGSTDRTDEIVRRNAAGHDWIELVQMPRRTERHFAGKVHAFNAGYARIKDLHCEVIGSLDADLSFDEDYFAFLLHQFANNPQLGVAGTPFHEDEVRYDFRFASTDHVSGACQLFRRQCFEAVGGYVPIKEGGIDLVFVTTARMKGWQTRTFLEKASIHHKKTQTQGTLKQTFKSGFHDYLMGTHPLWQILRSLQKTKPPRFVGGLMLLSGYTWAAVTLAKRPVSKDFVAFRRKEQMRRLGKFFTRKTSPEGFSKQAA